MRLKRSVSSKSEEKKNDENAFVCPRESLQRWRERLFGEFEKVDIFEGLKVWFQNSKKFCEAIWNFWSLSMIWEVFWGAKRPKTPLTPLSTLQSFKWASQTFCVLKYKLTSDLRRCQVFQISKKTFASPLYAFSWTNKSIFNDFSEANLGFLCFHVT